MGMTTMAGPGSTIIITPASNTAPPNAAIMSLRNGGEAGRGTQRAHFHIRR